MAASSVPRRAVLVYEGLPLSSGGAHVVRQANPHETWARVQQFIDECTDGATLRREVELRRAEPSHWLPVRAAVTRARRLLHGPTAVEQAAASATRLFGTPRREEEGDASPTETLFVETWRPQPDQFEAAIDWAVDHGGLPDYGFGIPPCASVSCSFRLRDPRTGDVLPFQGADDYLGYDFSHGYGSLLGESTLYARFARRTTVSVVLCLPFESVTPEARALASELQARLPFKMSPKQWTLWELNRKGTGYRPHKVALS